MTEVSEEKSVEELLRPRYKHIAPYPLSKKYMDVGDILTLENGVFKDMVESFPHLFLKLEWWEEREEKDMPKYVKAPSREIGKVDKWKFQDKKPEYAYIGRWVWPVEICTPVTESQYAEYTAQNKKT